MNVCAPRDGLEGPATRFSDVNSFAAQSNRWSQFLRRPEDRDAVAMHHLVAETKVLDLNSTYAYLLMATDFANTCIVADRDARLCGLITGYHPPTRPEVLFVWQVAVAESARGTGLAATMLDTLTRRVRQERRGQPLTVEATVAPSNSASRALFGAFARRHGIAMTEHSRFVSAHLDAGQAHEDEPVLRIGPIVSSLQN